MTQGQDDRYNRIPNGGPSFIVPGIWTAGANSGDPLSAEDRAKLALVATIARYKKGECIYATGAKADFVFNVIDGTVRSCIRLPNGTTHLIGFMFRYDVFGLAEGGRYVNAAEAVTSVTVYRIPASAAEVRLRRDPGLDFQVICKLCHELRAAQLHAVLLSRHRAIDKLCLFLQMLETVQQAHGAADAEIFLPMSRADIGAYVSISPEAVSRCLRELALRGIISFRDRRHVRVTDRTQFDAIIGGPEARRG